MGMRPGQSPRRLIESLNVDAVYMVLRTAKTKKHRIGMRDDRLSVGAVRGEPEVAGNALN